MTLQALDPIYANFFIPQQQLSEIGKGLEVRVTSDALPDQVITGRITAINPEVDAATRNIRVQATIANPDERLRPGMYANIAVVLPKKMDVLAIPATAVLYAPYSDSVFLIQENKGQDGKPGVKTVRQQFIRLGEKRGDFISVIEGLKPDDTVVSTGVFKLRNGQNVTVDNKLAPDFKLTPRPEES